MRLDELFNKAPLIIYIYIFLWVSEIDASSSHEKEEDLAPGLPFLNDEEVYSWNILRDYTEYFDNDIEVIKKNYPALEDHLIKSQWYSIIDVLQCEYNTDQEDTTSPARIKVKNLPENVKHLKSLWKQKNFILASLDKSEFMQKCVYAIRNLINHRSIVIETYDNSMLKSICHDSVTMFFDPAMLYEEFKLKTDFDKQRIPISRLRCIDKARIRIGQWSSIVHVHALDSEDGRDRIFKSEDPQQEEFLPYSPPDSFPVEIEVENFETFCIEALSPYYSRNEKKEIILEIFCKDAREIYYNNPIEVHGKYSIYGISIRKLKINEIKKKASKVNPPSLNALNLLEYRTLRISEWGAVIEQLNIDKDSKPRYDRVIGNISVDPRPYGFIASLNFKEFEKSCQIALINRVKQQEGFIKSLRKKNKENLDNLELEEDLEWERIYNIEIVDLDTFCRDAAGIYFGISRDSFAILRDIPLIEHPRFIDPGTGVSRSDLPPKILDLNTGRSIYGPEKIDNIEWRIEASSLLWEKLINYRTCSQLENAIRIIQWQTIKQQTNGFFFLNIGVEGFFEGINDPPKSIFSFSDDPFGMYSQCLHSFSESNRRSIKNNNYSINTDENSVFTYRWNFSKSISAKLLEKGINTENFEMHNELSTPIKQSLCIEAVKEYFEDPGQCPFISSEIESIKFSIKNSFPDSPFSNATDPKLADPDGDLEAKEQWNFIYEFSLSNREKASKINDEENIIVLSQKMPFSYLEFRHSHWRTKHECYQDMAVNCIQSSWPIVEPNWRNQKVITDLASALAIFCDTAAILYFERKKQWRQLLKLMLSQKYLSSFYWVRKGYYLPRSYKPLIIPIKDGKEGKIRKEDFEEYKRALVSSIKELIRTRYLAPLTVEISTICNSLAVDMSVSTTRGIWQGLVPVDSEVLIEMERLGGKDQEDSENETAFGYHPIRNQFSPRVRDKKRTGTSLQNYELRRNKYNQGSISMAKLKPPIKKTVAQNIRLLQYKEIVEKDEEDLPFEYPTRGNLRADWRKYINENHEVSRPITESQKSIHDFYRAGWAKPFGYNGNLKYGFFTYNSRVPKINRRVPFKYYKHESGSDHLSIGFGDQEDMKYSGDNYQKLPKSFGGEVNQYKNPRFNKIVQLDLGGNKIGNAPKNLMEYVKIPEIKGKRPLTKEEILERTKYIKLEDDELENNILTDHIYRYLDNTRSFDEDYLPTLDKKHVHSGDKIIPSKNKSLPSSEVIHSIIKSSKYYNIEANCIPHSGYELGSSVNQGDLMKGARFVYRCLRMDGHFVSPSTAYRIWLRSQYLRRNTPKAPLIGYKEVMKRYIKKRSSKDNQTYCPGKSQDQLDEIADTIATAFYTSNIFPGDKMGQICQVARELFNKRTFTLWQCIRALKKYITKVNGEFVVDSKLFPTVCTHTELELEDFLERD
ncbi:hypothetical protein HWI79_3045 [Cryptosporidium felis]|nr:hypothetical protein HWI79_3045 [Cryptosporidium felis]